jgi:hypothetical protein
MSRLGGITGLLIVIIIAALAALMLLFFFTEDTDAPEEPAVIATPTPFD